MAYQCWQLKAKGLPSAGRHQHKRISAGECIFNDLPLQRPELVVAEISLQSTEQFHDFLLQRYAVFRPANLPNKNDGLRAVDTSNLAISKSQRLSRAPPR